MPSLTAESDPERDADHHRDHGRHQRKLEGDREGVEDHVDGREARPPTGAEIAGQQAPEVLEVLDIDRLVEPEKRPQGAPGPLRWRRRSASI